MMKKITKIDELPKVQPTNNKLKVAAYARVSTDSDDQLISLKAQREHYENYIKSNPEWEFAGLYYDVDTPYGHNAKAHEQPIFALVHGLVVL
jgi:hypothetical protein